MSEIYFWGPWHFFGKIRCSCVWNTAGNSDVQGGETAVIQKDRNFTVTLNINPNVPRV